jgi:hypothetical protein
VAPEELRLAFIIDLVKLHILALIGKNTSNPEKNHPSQVVSPVVRERYSVPSPSILKSTVNVYRSFI